MLKLKDLLKVTDISTNCVIYLGTDSEEVMKVKEGYPDGLTKSILPSDALEHEVIFIQPVWKPQGLTMNIAIRRNENENKRISIHED